jgi:hypothetical protein
MSTLLSLSQLNQTQYDETLLDPTGQEALDLETSDPVEAGAETAPTVQEVPPQAPEGPAVDEPHSVEMPHAADDVSPMSGDSGAIAKMADTGTPEATAPGEPERVAAPGAAAEETVAETVRPQGLKEGSGAIALTPEDRETAFAGSPVVGSVVDGGSAQDMIDGKYPRPSVASQREIDEFNRLRQAGLDLNRPKNWPDFMTFPTEGEMRSLLQDGVTPEFIKDFEARKQLQADEMEVRAREINEWIFSFGDAGLNEGARMQRSRNRKLAVRRRATGPDGRVQKQNENDIDPSDLTDEELYGDRHYGIRFALLLNSSPDAITKLQGAPVAAWGHDQLRTFDGGRLQVKGDEIIVRKTSMEAARLLVMEAKARGWETIRVSGHNDFCAAVKRAAKEEGIGAIIHRRGPLGFGPFSRPEVVMPPIPRIQPLNRKDPNEPERERKAAAAPAEDREAAARLLQPANPSGKRSVKVEEPFIDPDRKRPAEAPEQPAPEIS